MSESEMLKASELFEKAGENYMKAAEMMEKEGGNDSILYEKAAYSTYKAFISVYQENKKTNSLIALEVLPSGPTNPGIALDMIYQKTTENDRKFKDIIMKYYNKSIDLYEKAENEIRRESMKKGRLLLFTNEELEKEWTSELK